MDLWFRLWSRSATAIQMIMTLHVDLPPITSWNLITEATQTHTLWGPRLAQGLSPCNSCDRRKPVEKWIPAQVAVRQRINFPKGLLMHTVSLLGMFLSLCHSVKSCICSMPWISSSHVDTCTFELGIWRGNRGVSCCPYSVFGNCCWITQEFWLLSGVKGVGEMGALNCHAYIGFLAWPAVVLPGLENSSAP